MPKKENMGSKIAIYLTKSGQTKLEVNIDEETVCLTQKSMSDLFKKDVRTINEHIKNIFREGELTDKSVILNFRTTQMLANKYQIYLKNLS